MITLTSEHKKVTIIIKHINFFRVYKYDNCNCRIHMSSFTIDVQETYDEVLALINNALK